MIRIRYLLVLALLLIARLTFAQSSHTISYQAYVLGADGKGLDDAACPVHVELRGEGASSPVLWSDDITVPITNGILNLDLGGHNPLPSSSVLDRQLSVAVSIHGNTPFVTRLSASPYALNVPDSSITAAKLGTDYVSAVTIDGMRITTKGGPLNLQAGEGLQLSYNEEANAVRIGIPNSQVVLSGGSSSTSNGCTTNNDGGEGTNTVVGGCANVIDVPSGLGTTNTYYSTIAGGQSNEIYSPTTNDGASWSVIAGGESNKIGKANKDAAQWAFIGAGNENAVWDHHGFIGDGYQNSVSEEYSAIVNGQHNDIFGIESFIGSGHGNVLGSEADEEYVVDNVIVGGLTNHIDPTTQVEGNFIGAGRQNTLDGAINRSVITGGDTNHITTDDYSSIVGGRGNTIDGSSNASVGAFIGGGTHNTVTSTVGVHDNATLAGGAYNHAEAAATFLGGGDHNRVSSTNGTLGGGGTNAVDEDAIYGSLLGGLNNNVLKEYGAVVGGSYNTARQAHGFVGGGTLNDAGDEFATIGGGDSNRILSDAGARSFIGGGDTNLLMSAVSVIGGGDHNIITGLAPYSTIGGGNWNRIEGRFSTIAGGDSNWITDVNADHNFIGGGLRNIEDNPSAGVIGGGYWNYIGYNGWGSAIGGGRGNQVLWALSFIGAGDSNTIYENDTYSALVGGQRNRVASIWSFLGGGRDNYAHGDFVTLGGGDSNFANTALGVLGGGYHNYIDYNSDTAVLVGGAHNYMDWGQGSFLGGGTKNNSRSKHSVLVGGENNDVDFNTDHQFLGGGEHNAVSSLSSEYSFLVPPGVTLDGSFASGSQFLGGGGFNTVKSSYATLVAGFGNTIDSNAVFSVLDGGRFNAVRSPFSYVGGGFHNIVEGAAGDVIVGGWENGIIGGVETKNFIGGGETNTIQMACWSVIGGGLHNTIFSDLLAPDSTANWDFLGGGQNNSIDTAEHASLAGGNNNTITAGGQCAAIPGGEGLIAQSFAQTVMGFNNIAKGAVFGATSSTGTDDPVVIVGNGTNAKSRSNAFEVSYNGHSTVFDQLGNASPRPPVFGGTYNDNIIDAWGDVPVLAFPSYPPSNDFGVTSVDHPAAGVFIVHLQSKNPDGSNRNYSGASITVTVNDDSPQERTGVPGFATASHIGVPAPNQFIVRTYNCACGADDRPFFFKVSGR